MVSDGYCKLVIDMTNITFIDSTGLGALISGLKATRKAGGDMRLACPGEQTLTLLRLTSLDRVLHPYATVDAAQASYK
jgi:anti-anti-sigma factor